MPDADRSESPVAPMDAELAQLPRGVREDVARARNAQIRKEQAWAVFLERSEATKVALRRLHRNHKLSPAKIGDYVGVSKTRVRQILGLK